VNFKRKPDRVRHDCSYAGAMVLEEVIGPHLSGMTPRELFSKAYTAIAGAIEKYLELKADERRRMKPLGN